MKNKNVVKSKIEEKMEEFKNLIEVNSQKSLNDFIYSKTEFRIDRLLEMKRAFEKAVSTLPNK